MPDEREEYLLKHAGPDDIDIEQVESEEGLKPLSFRRVDVGAKAPTHKNNATNFWLRTLGNYGRRKRGKSRDVRWVDPQNVYGRFGR